MNNSVSVSIDEKLFSDIADFCTINDFDIEEYINKSLRSKLSEDKWGDAPFLPKKEVHEEEVPVIPDVIMQHALKVLAEQNKKPVEPVVTESGEIDLGTTKFEGQETYTIPEKEETKQEILPEKKETKPKRRKLK